jgi:HlyD family secretion protein
VLGVAGIWAICVPLSAAVIVPGTLVVQSKVKEIQHPTGGVVAQILAHDGERVSQGDLLVRLDDTQVRANLQVVTKQLDEVHVRIARLLAERDGKDDLSFPPEFAAANEPLITSERALFKARAVTRQGQKDLLRNRIVQLGQQVVGLEAQIESKIAQIGLISSEQQGVQSLYDRQLVPLTRLTALQRDSARLEGDRGQLLSSIAETKSKISESELEIIRVDQQFRSEVMKDLREAQDKEAELAERKVAAQDQLDRIDIRAPTAGTVHQLSVHTIGGVIRPADVILQIVPESDELQIEARLQPTDIDQAWIGQNTHVRLSAFNQRTTPQFDGVVSYVSADLSRDARTNASFYTVRVSLKAEEARRIGNLQLVSGMPAEVFLQTGSRTMMSYLLKPITDQLQRAFSEH